MDRILQFLNVYTEYFLIGLILSFIVLIILYIVMSGGFFFFDF